MPTGSGAWPAGAEPHCRRQACCGQAPKQALGDSLALASYTSANRLEQKMYVLKRLRPFLAAIAAEDGYPRTPGRLKAEAIQGLLLVEPKGLGWFPFEALPPSHWHTGESVDPDILCWWVVLASYLKQPEETPLLRGYLDLLGEGSRASLGLFILQAFLNHDTRDLGRESDSATAETSALPTQDPPVETNALWRQLLGKHPHGNALDAKGILALAAGTADATLVALVASYFRDHSSRWAQQRILLLLLGASGTNSAIQFLVATAQRHPLPSVHALAGALASQVARGKGWTEEDLADRTIPSAGLDERGVLLLDYGPRRFQATLEDSLKLQLWDAAGKAIKALPAPKKGDDPGSVKAAKRALAECREGIRQVRAMWKLRLQEYLRTQKAWPVQDWRSCLLTHPIVGRLLQRLVWVDEAGRLFRPSVDGRLLDAGGQELVIEVGRVRLAHASLVGPELAQAWLRQGNALGIDWLFNQMDRIPPYLWLVASLDMKAINDQAGTQVDAMAFYGILKRLGYTRSGLSENQEFHSMVKTYTSLGIQVDIEFSGAHFPTWGGWSTLKTLHFTQLEGSKRMSLQNVSPVLLSESYADYQTVAQKAHGQSARPG